MAITGIVLRLLWAWRGIVIRGDSLDGSVLSFDKTTDAGQYIVLARNLRFHQVFSLGQGIEPLLPTFFRAPGYPLLIASLWTGGPTKPPIVALCLAQAILGALTAVITYMMAEERFGRRVALLAGMAMALAPMSGVWVGEILTETVFTFFIALACFFWGRENFTLAGITFGLSWLVRPTTMPFIFLLLVLAFLPPFRTARRGICAMSVAAIVVAGIWTVRNVLVFHRFVPVAVAGGRMSLLFGTYDVPYHTDVWVHIKEHEPSIHTGYAWDDPRNEEVYYQRALERISSDPLRWLIVRAKQMPRFFIDLGAYIYPNSRILTSVIKMTFLGGNVALFALAILAFYLERTRLVALSYLFLFPIFLTLFHLPMWIESRYSLPMMPFVILLACISLDAIYLRVRRFAGFAPPMIFHKDREESATARAAS